MVCDLLAVSGKANKTSTKQPDGLEPSRWPGYADSPSIVAAVQAKRPKNLRSLDPPNDGAADSCDPVKLVEQIGTGRKLS